MMFKVGDFVEVLDEDLSGEVIFVRGGLVTIQTDDDFELEFTPSQLVKSANKKLLKSVNFNSEAFDKMYIDSKSSKKKSVGVKPKERTQPSMEVDLHIHQLLPTTRGMEKHADRKSVV